MGIRFIEVKRIKTIKILIKLDQDSMILINSVKREKILNLASPRNSIKTRFLMIQVLDTTNSNKGIYPKASNSINLLQYSKKSWIWALVSTKRTKKKVINLPLQNNKDFKRKKSTKSALGSTTASRKPPKNPPPSTNNLALLTKTRKNTNITIWEALSRTSQNTITLIFNTEK